MLGAESKQGLERGHRGAAPVEADGELVEVDLEVVVTDARMRAPEPLLEMAEDPMHTGPERGHLRRVTLGFGAMAIAHAPERCVGSPAVRHEEGSGFDSRADEARAGRGRGVRHQLEPHPARCSAADLKGGHHQRCLLRNPG